MLVYEAGLTFCVSENPMAHPTANHVWSFVWKFHCLNVTRVKHFAMRGRIGRIGSKTPRSSLFFAIPDAIVNTPSARLGGWDSETRGFLLMFNLMHLETLLESSEREFSWFRFQRAAPLPPRKCSGPHFAPRNIASTLAYWPTDRESVV